MLKLDNLDRFYQMSFDALNARLKVMGYKLLIAQHIPDKFGDLLTIWRDNKSNHCYKWSWDGRNQLFALEEEHYIEELERIPWLDVELVAYEGHISEPDRWEGIVKFLVDSLEEDNSWIRLNDK